MGIITINNLSSALYEKIKEQEKFQISQLSKKVLGISYGAFLKRVKENRLLFEEVGKLAEYCGFIVRIEIDNLKFETGIAAHASENPPTKDLYKIIELTEQIGNLKLENQQLNYEVSRLKQEKKKK